MAIIDGVRGASRSMDPVAVRPQDGMRIRRFATPLVVLVVATFALSTVTTAGAQVTVDANGKPSFLKEIGVPPGVNGMAPKLGLAYSGGNVNGPVGYGWSMQGVSIITRCPANLATDRIVGAVTFGADDKLCLDGQRLIQVSPTSGDVINGSFPASGSTTPFQRGDAGGQSSGSFIEYRTEKDAYARIRSYGVANGSASTGPAYFRVWTKSGQINSYGADPSASGTSALILQTSQGSANAPAVAWAIARISDTLGNSIDFKYQQSEVAWGSGPASPAAAAPGHEWLLSEVSYGSNKVAFSYGARVNGAGPLDGSEAYQLGFKNVSTQLLRSVTTYAGATPVSTINLSYTVGSVSGRSLLSRLQECAGSSQSTRCLPATTFTYSAGGGDVYQPSAGFAASGLATVPLTNAVGTYGVLIGDFDGDGRADILRWSDNPASDANQLWLSRTNAGVDTFVKWPAGSAGNQFNLSAVNLSKSNGCFASITEDFNGDGLTDILNVAPSSDSCVGGNTTLYLSNGDGSFKSIVIQANIDLTQAVSTQTNDPLSPDGYYRSEGRNFYLLDVNGDGLLDIVTTILPSSPINHRPLPPDPCASRICTRVFLGQGDGTFQEFVGTNLAHQTLYSPPASALNGFSDPANTGDWNGDGLTDLYALSSGVWLSNGDGNFTFVSSGGGGGCGTPVDFNGDGRTDCLSLGTASSYLLTGGGGGPTGNFTLASQALVGRDAYGKQNRGVRILDANGDGRDDILVWSDTAANNALWLSNGDGTFTQSNSFKLDGANPVQLQSADHTTAFAVGDFTGHGAAEVLRMRTDGVSGNGAISNRLYTKVDASPPDLLTGVVSGSGASTAIYYVPLTNSVPAAGASQALGPRYTSDRSDANFKAVYPLVDMATAAYVVATVVVDSGVGSQKVATEYAYKGLKTDALGRGLLGFREVLRQGLAADGSALTTDSLLLQVYPYTGMQASAATYVGALNTIGTKTPISQVSNVYCDLTKLTGADSSTSAAAAAATSASPCPVGAKVFRPFLVSTSVSSKDLLGNPMPAVQTQNVYDVAGNVKSVTVSTTGTAAGINQTFQKSTNNVYQVDDTSCSDYRTCNWILGRVTQTTATSTVPNSLASIGTSPGSAPNATATSGNVQTPTIGVLALNPATITLGQGAALTWNASGGTAAATCTGALAGSGSTSPVTVSASALGTGACTVTVTNSISQSITSSPVTATVVAAPTIATASFAAAIVTTGGTNTLTWSVGGGATSGSVVCSGAATGSGTSSPMTVGTMGMGSGACTVTATNAAGTQVSTSRTFSVVGAPTVAAASFAAANVTTGNTNTLMWSVGGGATSGSVVCSGAATGSGTSSPMTVGTTGTGTGTCTVTATNADGAQASTSRTFSVVAAPTVAAASFAAANVTTGNTNTMTWSVGGGATSGSVVCSGAATGSGSSSPLTIGTTGTGTGTCTITATNADGAQASTTRTFSVVAAPTVAAASFAAANVTTGNTNTLTWSVGGGATSGSVVCSGAATGSGSSSPMTVGTTGTGVGTCTVTATNAANSTATSSVSFNVVAAPSITSASMSGVYVTAGNSIVFNWSAANAVSTVATCSGAVTGGGSGSANSGSISIAAGQNAGTGTCTVIATNAAGSTVQASASTNVVLAPYWDGNPRFSPTNSVTVGGTVNFNWGDWNATSWAATCSNGASVSADNSTVNNGNVKVIGISASSSASCTATIFNAAGTSISQTVPLTVVPASANLAAQPTNQNVTLGSNGSTIGTFTISNQSSVSATSLAIGIINYGGTGKGKFLIATGGTCVAGGSLDAGAWCTVKVEFDAGCGPAATKTAQLSVAGAAGGTPAIANLAVYNSSGVCN
ncbi:FG-GAP-like repeat-containing protein [Paucibacter sp. R3-3]|uniref:FG-GAP-like repeat-containing protein n=1 Tax=Roseateles agri TaxID=3098619 RepID=A0ABU5DAT8_9BURK|nr:FG-GAP-like repeat-containing protein [Paucibacter sp. R3-3]MDY0743344.1 FG-GAP-like repeat-containing protein [Paucibacter sp. R3-3]